MKKYLFDVKRVRKIKGLTQKELAKISGITQQKLSNYECGNNVPLIDNAAKIAEALGVSLDELILIRDAKERVAKQLKDIISGEKKQDS